MMTTPTNQQLQALNAKKEYFNWILRKIGAYGGEYNTLLSYLFAIEFMHAPDVDANRYNDGAELIYTFAFENHMNYTDAYNNYGHGYCSVLELMAASALKMEHEYMYNTDFGDRTALWFWDMLQSLGLDKFDDAHFDTAKVNRILDIFMSRRYKPNGSGGLVTLTNPTTDLRNVEIWTQMIWKIHEYVQIFGV